MASSAGANPAGKLTQDEIEFHKRKTEIAREVMNKLMVAEGGEEFDKADGSDGLEPPSADVPDVHFQRRLLANEVLAATEDYMWDEVDAAPDTSGTGGNGPPARKTFRGRSIIGADGQEQRLHPAVEAALEATIAERKSGIFGSQDDTPAISLRAKSAGGVLLNARKSLRQPSVMKKHFDSVREDDAGFDEDSTLKSLKKPARRSSILHDEINHLIKTDGVGMGGHERLAHGKPVLKDPMGLKCVAALHDPKWTKLARAIRDSIYDPDFYDDGTYAPQYVRLAIHGSATYRFEDNTGGLEGGAMRYKPEYSDAHNKFCKQIIKRQHDVLKVPFPWASYADIQCLCAYVAIECAGGPVIEFTPGRRDVLPPGDLKESIKEPEGEDFVLLNYRERGDVGLEDEPVKCPSTGKTTGECVFMRKAKVYPGRVPGSEQGYLGKPFAPVTPEAEKKEMEAVAAYIRHVFVEGIGANEQQTVALISGGHSFGRCHPQISGYAGPWQSNPGYFNNVYCQKLLTEDWKVVDRNMEDCSGDVITGLKPYGMRRQYVNKGGKGDLMMLVSDMALRRDPVFSQWLEVYAKDNERLKADFAIAFKWVTELGFEKPKGKRGFAKLMFNFRKFKVDAMQWLSQLCYGSGDAGGGDGPVLLPADAPKKGDPYTIEDVQKHASKEDCWVSINGKVCNLTNFMGTHPGGVAPIEQQAGKDASFVWNAIHSKDTIEKIAPDVVIGYLVASK